MPTSWEQIIKIHGPGVSHHDQDPPMWINVKITDATRTTTQVTATINTWIYASQQSTAGPGSTGYKDNWFFGYPLGVAVSIGVTTNTLTPMFDKPTQPYQWEDKGAAKINPTQGQSIAFNGEATKTLTYAVPSTSDVYVRIWFYTTCTCSDDPSTPHQTVDNKTYYLVGTYTIPGQDIPVTDYTLSYDANGGSGAPASQTGTTLTVSSTVPTKSAVLTYNANGGAFVGGSSTATKNVSLTFNGWSTSQARADAGQVDYHGGDSITLSANTTLWASWSPGAIGALPTIGTSAGQLNPRTGYRLEPNKNWTTTQNGSTGIPLGYTILTNTTIWAKWQYQVLIDPNGGYILIDGELYDTPQPFWKTYGTTLVIDPIMEMSGKNFLGFSTSSSATTPTYTTPWNYTSDTPLSVYAVWGTATYVVRFYDGYTDPGATHADYLKSVTVSYGGNVPVSQLPVVGQTYNSHVFQKPGIWTLVGWTGPYDPTAGTLVNITSDISTEAIWDFAPIWVRVNQGGVDKWIPYKPKEH